jgi:hypothetical protein
VSRRALVGALALLLAAVVAHAERLEDPTRPAWRTSAAAPAESATATLRVDSIWLSDGHAAAVIGGRRVAPGDAVAGGRVVEIGLGGVRVRRTDGDVFLTLAGGDPKRPASERTEP